MLELNDFTAGLSIAGFVIIIMVLFAAGLGKKLKDKPSIWFFYLVLFNLLSALPEFIMMPLLGRPGMAIFVLLKFLDYLTYVFSALAMIAFVNYVHDYLATKTSVSLQAARFIRFFCYAALPFHAVAEGLNLYSHFDAWNIYHKSAHFWIGYVPNIIAFLICFFVVLRHRKSLRPQESIALLLYMVAPISCYLLESYYASMWIVYFGIAITLLLIYIVIQVELMQRVLAQNAELAESRTAIMLSQIQPHFLYNTLNTIGDMCVTDPALAQETVFEFSDYLRANMDSLSSPQLIPFEKELSHVETYLALEQKRFEERLLVRYEIGTTDFHLPPLTVQPIVENAVLHGITVRHTPGTVLVKTEEVPEGFRITVTDDGVGFDPAAPLGEGSFLHTGERSHVGIENVKKRLAAGCGGSLSVESTAGSGTRVTILIPRRGGDLVIHILAVDDEPRGINMLSRAVQSAVPDAALASYQNPFDALEHARAHPVHVAFLDVRMPGMDGLTLAISLKELHPKINIIFVTGYREYAVDAFALHASGFVYKPVSPAAVREQMENLRFPLSERAEPPNALGPYAIEHATQRVYYMGQDALLTQKEFLLLCLFAEHPGECFPPEELFAQIWGSAPQGNLDTVKVHVSSLRRKLAMGKGRNPNIVKQRNAGYQLRLGG